MIKQFDIAPARKRVGVTQKEVEVELGLPAVSMSGIEDGRILIDTEMYDRIHSAISAIAARKKEEAECDRAALASAGT